METASSRHYITHSTSDHYCSRALAVTAMLLCWYMERPLITMADGKMMIKKVSIKYVGRTTLEAGYLGFDTEIQGVIEL